MNPAQLRYLWNSVKGNRLTPWRSPYLRWRIETYWGWEADHITPGQFWSFVWTHRHELSRFLSWAARMDQQQKQRRPHHPDGSVRPFTVAPDA